MSRARNLANRAGDFSSARDSGAVTGSSPYSMTITGNNSGSSYLSCISGGAVSTNLQQYGPSAAGTTLGINNADLGVLQFSSANSGLIYTSNALASLRLATNGAVRVTIDPSGSVTFPSNTGTFGYGTGAGGTVTQTTSKSTAVTLNRPSGRITTHTQALGAGVDVAFIFLNSLITADDHVIVTPSNSGRYRVECVNVVAGAAAIRVTNITAGSLSEAVPINFMVLKGAIA